MTDELAAQLKRMAAEISALAADCDLPLQDADAVREYLAHDELGVALELLCDTLIETEAPITESQCRRILDAAKALGMLQREPKAWKIRLETLLTRIT
jgi:hypothetical protein